jgi:predicted GIY-YIG superfamily endonuclease
MIKFFLHNICEMVNVQYSQQDLYLIQARGTGSIKIGKAKDCEKRLKQLQTGNAVELRLIHVFKGYGNVESALHKELKTFRESGEWFSYRCVGSIPTEIYEQIPYGALDNWWVSR